MRKLWVACALVFFPFSACDSPSSVYPTIPAPPPKDGIVVLDGTISGTFTFTNGPVKSRGSFLACGDAKITVPYRETAGGMAGSGDYALLVLDNNGPRRTTKSKVGSFTVRPLSRGSITFFEPSVCVEYTDASPPRGQVAVNFGGMPGGTVSQLAGVSALTLVP